MANEIFVPGRLCLFGEHSDWAGKYRTMNRPKRKKIKHVQIDYNIPEWIQSLIKKGKPVQDSDVIKVRREYGRK